MNSTRVGEALRRRRSGANLRGTRAQMVYEDAKCNAIIAELTECWTPNLKFIFRKRTYD